MTQQSTSPAGLPAIMQSGALAGLEDQAKAIILRQMRPVKLKAGDRVFQPGDQCFNYLVLKAGSVKVSVTTESGREIVLYRVVPGETCVLTAACLMAGTSYDAEGVAETETEAIILPKPAFDELLATSARFRQFVFSSYGERLNVLIGLVQEIAVRHVDRRLARLLSTHARDGIVAMTHKAIADELNTAREVVTRLITDFTRKGWVEAERGRIRVLDADAIQEFSGGM